MCGDDMICQVVPLLLVLAVFLTGCCFRPITRLLGSLAERFFLALYENTGWLILGALIDDRSPDD
jgi:hypothetical protein